MKQLWLCLALLSASCLPLSAAEPKLTPPPGFKQVHEFRLQGAILERMRERHSGLEGVKSILVRRYQPSVSPKRAPVDVDELAPAVRQHFSAQMTRLGWTPLVQDSAGDQRGAAYASPDGTWLFSFNTDRKGAVATLIEGQVALYQIPDLERLIVRSLGRGHGFLSDEDLRLTQQARKLVRDGHADQAVALLKAQVAKKPESPGLRMALAEAYARAGRKTDQLSELKAAVGLDPAGYGPRLEYGRALFDAARYDEAMFQLEQAASLAPDKATPYYFIGRIYQSRSQHKQALDAFDKASQLGGRRWVSLAMRRGEVYEKLGDLQAAGECYRRALEIRPGYDDAQKALARVRSAQKPSDN